MSIGRCVRCDRAVELRYNGPTGRLCRRCYRQLRTFFCPGCGGEREVHSATRDDRHQPVLCWDCRQEATVAAQTRAVAEHVESIEPAMTEAVILAAVEAAAPSRVERKHLAEQLAAHPDSLVSGTTGATRVVCRLATALVASGATRVKRPCCGRCGKAKMLVVDTDEHGRICSRCDQLRRAEPCSICGRTKTVAARAVDGRPTCGSCRSRDPVTHAVCSQCGQPGRVIARTGAGDAICRRCYEQPVDRCSGCGQTATINARSDGATLCSRCYRHPRRACGGCGRIRRIYRREFNGVPDLCRSCAGDPIAKCVRCGTEQPGYGASTGSGHRCFRCLAVERVDAVLTDLDGAIPDELAGLREALLAAHQPRSVLNWLAGSPAIPVLAQLANGELGLTHETLDRMPATASLRHLRQLLIATGALPELDPGLAGLERFIADTVDRVTHPGDARVLRGYGTWRVLGRLRRRATLAYYSADNARDQFNQAAQFVGWLHQHGLELGTCNQHQVERWLADGPGHRRNIRPFLLWAIERGALRDITPPAHHRPSPSPATNSEAGWDHARRLLHDNDIDPADRVIGTLVVLYAQPLTRIARLRLDDIVDIDGDIHLNLGKEPVFMPEPLAGFLRQLPWRRQTGPSGHAPTVDNWLFPGRQAGRHQHPDYLAARLRNLGIPTRASRSTALARLAAQLPARVLADLLNIHINTAVRWIDTAGGNWTRYTADRIRRPRKH